MCNLLLEKFLWKLCAIFYNIFTPITDDRGPNIGSNINIIKLFQVMRLSWQRGNKSRPPRDPLDRLKFHRLKSFQTLCRWPFRRKRDQWESSLLINFSAHRELTAHNTQILLLIFAMPSNTFRHRPKAVEATSQVKHWIKMICIKASLRKSVPCMLTCPFCEYLFA